MKGTVWTAHFVSQYNILKMSQKMFQFIKVDGSKQLLKYLCLTIKWGILVICLVMFTCLDVEIKSKIYFIVCLLISKGKKVYPRYCRSHKPISWYSFSLYLPVIVFAMPKATLNWVNSSLSWKEFLNVWSDNVCP